MNGKRSSFLQSDYDQLDKVINRRKVYKLADVQDRIEKVAFDVVRFRDSGGLDKLWLVQDQEGEQVIVAMYDDEEDQQQKEATANWSAIADGRGNVNVFYKNEPIVRLAMKQFGLDAEDAGRVSRFLPEKLASEKGFAASLVKELSSSEREVLLSKYPELKAE